MMLKVVRQSRQAANLLRCTSVRCFSSEEPAAAAEKAPEPTKEELDASRAEWGIKYDDECLKFEKEWKEIADRVQAE